MIFKLIATTSSQIANAVLYFSVNICFLSLVFLVSITFFLNIIFIMFQNSYQNGTFFEIFDAKANQDKLKLLYKTTNVGPNYKVFDKELKTYVFETLNPTAHLYLPKQDKKDLYLIQQYLVLQVYFFQGLSWSIELTVSDLTKTKRRIILSPATTKSQVKPFFVKTVCSGWQEGVWNNFVVDLYSYIQAFKGQTYRSLDSIHLTGHFRLRRIYTSVTEPMSENIEFQSPQMKQVHFLPKNFNFPLGVPSVTKFNRYEGDQISQIASQVQSSTKNSSFVRSTKTRQKTRPLAEIKQQQIKKEVKVEQTKSQQVIKIQKQSAQKGKANNTKKKDFLSNTNGDLVARKKQKNRISLQKTTLNKKVVEVKQKSNLKINPWRNNKEKQGLTDQSHLDTSKVGSSHRKIETPSQFSAHAKKADRVSQFDLTKQHFGGKSDHYNEVQYVELSQKFSTFTQGKFFKKDFATTKLEIPKIEQEDEIEQNIQSESNSMYSPNKQEQKIELNKQIEFLKQSIDDSLDRIDSTKIDKKIQIMGRSSLYGFGQKLMHNFMNQIQRPYSPPLGQRQVTEEEQVQGYRVQKEQVQLIYDPVLNCYYDHKTHTYYQLKN